MTDAAPVPPVDTVDLEDHADVTAWRATFTTVFGMSSPVASETAQVVPHYRGQRLVGVRDGGRWVATFRDWDGTSTVPGPALVGTGASDGTEATRALPTVLVSTVAVVPTHRRRGLLRRLMRHQLDAATQRGAALASLFASETAIYGRYGFGVATQVSDLVVDARGASVPASTLPDDGLVRPSDDDELAAVGPDLFERARLTMPGQVGRNAIAWLRLLERLPAPGDGPAPPRHRVVHEDADGRVDGLLRLRTEMHWDGSRPAYTAAVDDLVATSPTAAAALWRFALSVDLVATVKADQRAAGDLVHHLVDDPRAVTDARRDGHWWRVLDPVAALGGRTWATAGRVVLEVVDPDGPAGGRFLVDVDEDGEAQVGRTTKTADLTLPVASLAPVVSGALPLRPLHAAGLVDEHAPGGLVRLEQMSFVPTVALSTVQGF